MYTVTSNFNGFNQYWGMKFVRTNYDKHINQRKKLKSRTQNLRGKPKLGKTTGERQMILLYQSVKRQAVNLYEIG